MLAGLSVSRLANKSYCWIARGLDVRRVSFSANTCIVLSLLGAICQTAPASFHRSGDATRLHSCYRPVAVQRAPYNTEPRDISSRIHG
ncbi:hypothetical protein BJX96DRAFT_145736 [Aspergillus floccosus]